METGDNNGVQGTFTGGIGAVGRGTKCGCPGASTESATTATVRIASQRIQTKYDGIHIATVKHLTPRRGFLCRPSNTRDVPQRGTGFSDSTPTMRRW